MINPALFGAARRQTARPAVALAALLALSAAAEAQAQTVRFIRTTGNDANACTVTAPCRTLARGIAAAPVRGEVRVLDSGSFGAGVTIAKSLTISGNGNTLILAGPLTIDNSGPKVALENLLFNGRGVTQTGVVIANAASVHIVGCKFERFTADGIFVDGAGAELFVADSISRNNGEEGLEVFGNGATKATVVNSRFENNAGVGLSVASAEISIAGSTFSGNGVYGLNAVSAETSVADSTFSSNGTHGLNADDGQTSITHSTFSGNGVFGVNQDGGSINVTSTTAANNDRGYRIGDGGNMQLESSVARGHQSSQFSYGIYVSIGSLALISNLVVTNNEIGIENQGTVLTRQNNLVSNNDVDTVGNALTPLAPK